VRPRVSVVIPTHNRAHLLGAAIASVIRQTFQDFEIIVVDDASSDGTEEVARNMVDERIRYVRHSTRRYVSAARNSGVLTARGELLAFLDDDDEWLPAKLERQVAVLDACAPVVGGVYTGFHMIERATGKTLGTITPTMRGHILHELCHQNCIGTASTMMLRRECLQEVGLFDETVDYGEEYDMWIRVARRYEFTYLEEPLVRYSVHPAQLSTDYSAMIRGSERKLQKYESFFATYPEDLGRRYLALGTYRCYMGKMREGRGALRRAIRASPWTFKNYAYYLLSLLGPEPFRRKIRSGASRMLSDEKWRARDFQN
jgi:glycosyltransferase involved in cell wall biosynthesis